MLELPMAAFGGYQIPTIAFDQFDHISHFHYLSPLLPKQTVDYCHVDILPQLDEERLTAPKTQRIAGLTAYVSAEP